MYNNSRRVDSKHGKKIKKWHMLVGVCTTFNGLLFISGLTMLIVGIVKVNQKDSSTIYVTSIPSSPIPTTPLNILHFAVDPGLPWDDSYYDLNATKTQRIIEDFVSNITNLLNSQSFSQQFPQSLRRAGYALDAKLTLTAPDYLTISSTRSTYFYGSLVFEGPISANDVQNAIRSKGWVGNIQSSSHGFCLNLVNQPPPPSIPLGDFPCDPRTPPRIIIIMVDISQPTDPTILENEKLDSITSHIRSICPPMNVSWTGFQIGIGVFYGSNAFLINNWLCSDSSCLEDALIKLALDPTSESHNVTRAFEFIRDEFSNPSLQLPLGNARILTILADGFEYDGGFGEKWSRQLAQVLSETFYLTTIVASESLAIQRLYSSFSQSEYRYVNLRNWKQLADPQIHDRQLSWICQARPLSTTPSIPSTATWEPLRITTQSLTDPTAPSRFAKFCQDPIDVLLILHIPNDSLQEDLSIITDFITGALLKVLGGLDYGNTEKLTRLGVITYSGSIVNLIQSLPACQGTNSTITQIQNVQSVPIDSEISLLSRAYNMSLDQFRRFGRPYASWSTIVITDSFDLPDVLDATNYKNALQAEGISVFGLGLSEDRSKFPGINEILDEYLLVKAGDLLPITGQSSILASNTLHDYTCNNLPDQELVTRSTVPFTGSTYYPGFLPQGNINPQQWPDVVVLLDTSADLIPGSYALNDRGFEVIRIFLVNTFKDYKIGDAFTKVALMTFDAQPKTIFTFNTHPNWESLYKALTEDWQYGPSSDHQSTKAFDLAIDQLFNEIYQPKAGYRLKDQFLWIFTTGPQNMNSNNRYQALLNQVGQAGINVIGIALGDVDNDFMTNISSRYLPARNYADPLNGMASPRDLIGSALFQISTGQSNPPPIPKTNADIVIAVDLEMSPDLLDRLRNFLRKFVEQFNIGPNLAQFALVLFDRSGIVKSFSMKDQYDPGVLINNILSIQPRKGDDFQNAAYDQAINFITADMSSASNGKRSDVANFTIFFTQNANNNYTIPVPNTWVELNNTCAIYSILLDNSSMPLFLKELASRSTYTYVFFGDLMDWSISVSGESTMIQSFFQDLQLANMDMIRSLEGNLAQIDADIVMLYDLANLKVDSFQSIRGYLEGFVTRFTLSAFNTQIAGIIFADEILDDFSLDLCQDINCLNEKFESWNFTVGSNTRILIECLDHVDQQQFVSNKGWRRSRSYILVFSAQTSFNWTAEEMLPSISSLHNKNTFIYYIDLSDGSVPFDDQSLFDGYKAVVSIEDLSIGSDDDNHIVTTITTDYLNFHYPPPLMLANVVSDFIFIVDLSTNKILPGLKDLFMFMLNGVIIDMSYAQFSLICFNGNGTLWDLSFILNEYTTNEALNRTIAQLEQPEETWNTEIGSSLKVIDELVLSKSLGYREGLVFITVFIANSNVSSTLNNYIDSITRLQTRPYVNFYGFDLGDVDSGNQIYITLRSIIPLIMSATQIVKSSTIDADSGVISGGNGYLNYIIDTYASYQQHVITASSTRITTIRTSTLSTQVSSTTTTSTPSPPPTHCDNGGSLIIGPFEPNFCLCYGLWEGPTCSEIICINGGQSIDNVQCNCTPNFDGLHCEIINCPQPNAIDIPGHTSIGFIIRASLRMKDILDQIRTTLLDLSDPMGIVDPRYIDKIEWLFYQSQFYQWGFTNDFRTDVSKWDDMVKRFIEEPVDDCEDIDLSWLLFGLSNFTNYDGFSHIYLITDTMPINYEGKMHEILLLQSQLRVPISIILPEAANCNGNKNETALNAIRRITHISSGLFLPITNRLEVRDLIYNQLWSMYYFRKPILVESLDDCRRPSKESIIITEGARVSFNRGDWRLVYTVCTFIKEIELLSILITLETDCLSGT